MLAVDDVLAIPLWINGRAYLTVTPEFQEICSPETGQVLRRIPLCGAAELRIALESAEEVSAPWGELANSTRAMLLNALAEALQQYAAHFSGMLVEEAGQSAEAAEAEVAAALVLLRNTCEPSAAGVVAVLGDRAEPLLGALRLAVPAWLGGSSVIVCTSPAAPSCLFALAELSARCGFPGGVFNVLHGDARLTDELRLAGVRLLVA